MAIPIPRIYAPQTITTGTNDDFKVRLTKSAATATYTGTLTGTTRRDIETLVSDAASAVSGLPGGVTVTGAVSAAGIVTFTVAGVDTDTDVILKWSTNTKTQALGTLLGFGTSDTTHTGTGTSRDCAATNTAVGLWSPDMPVVFDSEDVPTYEVSVVEAVAGPATISYFGSRTVRSLRFEHLLPAKIYASNEVAATSYYQSIQRLLESAGRSRFRYYADRSQLGTASDSGTADASGNNRWRDYFLRQPSMERIDAARFSAGLNRWSLALEIGAYVA